MRRGSGADDASVPKRLLLVVALAATLALTDLAVKVAVATGAWDFHRRSHWWVALSLVLLLGAIAAARLPSRSVAVAAGVLSGGVLGNLVSAGWYGGRVPNPIVVEGGEGAVAFNLADVFALAGILLLMVSLSRVTVRHRHLLPSSTVAVRAARRLLGGKGPRGRA